MVLVGRAEDKRRPRRRWKDNIKMDLREIGINIRLAQDRMQLRAFVNTVMNLRVS
jgi:tRNA threonylcarbamoyladenosine modification (KEOPS) complex  Pcc1 subunit